MMTLLVVDDHAAIREPLAILLRHVATGVTVLEAGSMHEAMGLLAQTDLAIVDLALPDGSGTAIIERLKRERAGALVLVLTSNVQTVETARAVAAGADGVLHKSAPFSTVLASVKRLLQGERLISPEERSQLRTIAAEADARDDAARSAQPRLTPRELEVLAQVAEGLTDKEIAAELGIGIETVRTHLVNVFQKLGAASRLQAIRHAIRYKLIDPFE